MSVSISVIVPVLDGERTIRRCVESVLASIHSDGEVVVVDNGSVDNTRDILGTIALSDRRVKVVEESVRGVSRARNTGLRASTGRVIAFCDADDTWRENAASELLYAMDQGCECAILGGRVADGTGDAPAWLAPSLAPTVHGKRGPEAVFTKGCKPFLQRFALKRCMLEGLSFDETVSIGEDMLFMARACLRADDVWVSDIPIFDYRWTGENTMAGDVGDLASKHVQVVESLLFKPQVARRLRRDEALRNAVTLWAAKYVGRFADVHDDSIIRAQLKAALGHVGVSGEERDAALIDAPADVALWLAETPR